jgi:hypothetical protein
MMILNFDLMEEVEWEARGQKREWVQSNLKVQK